MIPPRLDLVVPEQLGRVHFIGIGGSGMSGIAHMMVDAGVPVSGSDREEGPYLARLRERGVRVEVGHRAQNLGDADTIVYTSALWPDNPEYLAARERGLTLLHRSQALHWLSRRSRGVTVAGAHGKTTSTGMIVTILRGVGRDPGFVNGGVISALGTSSATGSDGSFVLEGDESDGSFLLYDTSVALITNVDADHLDHYGDQRGFEDAFVSFCDGVRETVVAGEGDQLDAVLARVDGPRVVRFGESEGVDYRVTGIRTGAEVHFEIETGGRAYPARIAVTGRHNAINATGAVATVVEAFGVDIEQAIAALAAFGGTKRRFEFKGEARGVRVFDDYAHNPTEAAAAVAGARSVVGSGRVIAVHQPHLYSRTRLMSDDFARVYEELADFTVVLAVDGAREDPEPGVSGQLVVDGFADKSRVALREDWGEASELVASLAREGDIVMTLSCGSVYRMIPRLLDALASDPPNPA